MLVYLGDRGGRRTVSRQRRREKNDEVERRWLCRGVEALARHAVRGRKEEHSLGMGTHVYVDSMKSSEYATLGDLTVKFSMSIVRRSFVSRGDLRLGMSAGRGVSDEASGIDRGGDEWIRDGFRPS